MIEDGVWIKKDRCGQATVFSIKDDNLLSQESGPFYFTSFVMLPEVMASAIQSFRESAVAEIVSS